jgi:hypothetical protein
LAAITDFADTRRYIWRFWGRAGVALLVIFTLTLTNLATYIPIKSPSTGPAFNLLSSPEIAQAAERDLTINPDSQSVTEIEKNIEKIDQEIEKSEKRIEELEQQVEEQGLTLPPEEQLESQDSSNQQSNIASASSSAELLTDTRLPPPIPIPVPTPAPSEDFLELIESLKLVDRLSVPGGSLSIVPEGKERQLLSSETISPQSAPPIEFASFDQVKFQLVNQPDTSQSWEKVLQQVKQLVGGPTTEQLEIAVVNSDGQEIPIKTLEDVPEQTLTIQLDTKDLRPGKNILQVVDPQSTKMITQDFTWGVLAINPNKSIYVSASSRAKEDLPPETSQLAMAVLDEQGEMVCDALLRLKIQAPVGAPKELSTQDGTIQVNPECQKHAITTRPDYQAEYQTGKAGIYKLTLTAYTKNGIFTIYDQFEVRDWVPFDVERIAPTRIYPPETYPVNFQIRVNQNFFGTIEEVIPQRFKVECPEEEETETSQPPCKVGHSDKEQTINWQVNWQEGETHQLGYYFRAPIESPALHLLGPLTFYSTSEPSLTREVEKSGTDTTTRFSTSSNNNRGEDPVFQETRQWQVAVDTDATVIRYATSCTSVVVGWNDVTNAQGSPDNSSSAVLADFDTTDSASDEADEDDDLQCSGFDNTSLGTFLSAKVFVSFATNGAGGDDDEIEIDYDVNSGGWNNLAVIVQNAEQDNNSNGGYWEYAAGNIASWANVGQTTVRFLGDKVGGPDNHVAYVDAVWVEVTYTLPNVDISGNIYVAGSEVTTNSTSVSVSVSVDDASPTTITSQTSSYTFTAVDVAAGNSIAVYIDGHETLDANSITVTDASTDITNFHLYIDKTAIDNHNAGSTTNTNVCNQTTYPASGDNTFTCSASVPTYLDDELHLYGTYGPSGDVNAPKLHVASGGTYTGFTETLTLSGSGSGTSRPLYIDSGTFTPTSNTTKFTGTSASDVEATTYYNLTIDPASGTPTFSANGAVIANNELVVADGTLAMGVNNLTVGSTGASNSGSIKIGGTISQSSSATTTVKSSASGSNCIGANGASCAGTPGTIGFHNLTIGDSSTTFTTSIGGTSPAVTVAGVLNITTNATLRPNATTAITLSGSGTPITRSGTFDAATNAGSTVTYTSGSGVTALSSADMTSSNAFHNLTINNAGQTFTAGVAITVNDELLISGGTLAMGGNNLIVGKTSETNSGSIKIASGQTISQSSSATTTIYSSASGSNCIGSSGASCVGTPGTIGFGGLTIGDASTTFTTSIAGTSPTVTVGAALNITTSATLSATGTLEVAGNFDNDSTFTANSSTVSLNGSGGSTQAVTSTSTLAFYTLSATTSSHRTIEFEAGTTFTVNTNGNLTLTGTSCTALLILRSTTPGSYWNLNRVAPGSGSTSVSWVDVSDSNATGQTISTTNTVDSGHNSSWNITAIGCEGASSGSIPTGNSFQRKTFYDEQNETYWLFYHDGGQIVIKYSRDDGGTWDAIDGLAFDTNDFSVWWKFISGSDEYVLLAVNDSNDIKVRVGTMTATSISWDATTDTVFTGSTYSYPYITLDSSNNIWVGATKQSGSNYVYETIKSNGACTTALSSLDWNDASQIINDQTDANVYGNIASLGSNNMYATVAVGSTIEGCKWDNSSSDWVDANSDSCVSSGSGESEGSSSRSSSGASKIDDAGDPGAMPGAGSQIVQTSGGTLYAVINDGGNVEVYSSSDGSSWTQRDSGTTVTTDSGDPVSIAIDSSDQIHVVYLSGVNVRYRQFNTIAGTPVWNSTIGEETVRAFSNNAIEVVVAVDSDNKPHVVANDISAPLVEYNNRISGSWKTAASAPDIESVAVVSLSMLVNEDDIVEIAYVNTTDSDLTGAVGNVNDAASFTVHDVDTDVNNTSNQRGCSIGIDDLGNTWIAYIDDTNNYVALTKHADGTTWNSDANWTVVSEDATLDNNNVGYEPSLAMIGKTVFVFYQEDSTDQKAVYDVYDTGTADWLGETDLATPGAGDDMQDVKVRYSKFNFHEPWLLDYLYVESISGTPTDIYWNYVDLRPVNIDDASDFGPIHEEGTYTVRKSTGEIYTFLDDGGDLEAWKSSDGYVWEEQDALNKPTSSEIWDIAIDASDVIYMAYYGTGAFRVIDLTNDVWGSSAIPNSGCDILDISGDIAIDSNNIVHSVLICDEGSSIGAIE